MSCVGAWIVCCFILFVHSDRFVKSLCSHFAVKWVVFVHFHAMCGCHHMHAWSAIRRSTKQKKIQRFLQAEDDVDDTLCLWICVVLTHFLSLVSCQRGKIQFFESSLNTLRKWQRSKADNNNNMKHIYFNLPIIMTANEVQCVSVCLWVSLFVCLSCSYAKWIGIFNVVLLCFQCTGSVCECVRRLPNAQCAPHIVHNSVYAGAEMSLFMSERIRRTISRDVHCLVLYCVVS